MDFDTFVRSVRAATSFPVAQSRQRSSLDARPLRFLDRYSEFEEFG